MGLAGFQAFGEMLAVNKTLTKLSLQVNYLDDAGCDALSQGLDSNTTLDILLIGAPLSTGGARVSTEKYSSLAMYPDGSGAKRGARAAVAG